MVQNSRFLRALRREDVDTTPVWVMRQAGRYLPEYRKVREEAGDFLTLCKTPKLACEVTLQPLRRFDLDAAILFSDILTIPDAMGLGLTLEEGVGPRFKRTIRSPQDLNQIKALDVESDLGYVFDAASLIRANMPAELPLIGFCGSPWTLAVYMVEGGGTKEFAESKGLMYRDPQTLHALLDALVEAAIAYLVAQVEAGVNALMIFDTWGGVLPHKQWHEFSLRPMQRIIDGVRANGCAARVPIIVFSKGAGMWLEDMIATGADALGLDWTVNIGAMRAQAAGRVALQGNLDPCVLYADKRVIDTEVAAILSAYGNHAGHVFNLGHGIHPKVNPDNMGYLVDAVHRIGKRI